MNCEDLVVAKITVTRLYEKQCGHRDQFVVALEDSGRRKVLYAGTLTEGDHMEIGPVRIRFNAEPVRKH